jgi:hypothetical protein
MNPIFVLVLLSLVTASAADCQTASETEHCRTQKLAARIETASNLKELSELRKDQAAPIPLDFFFAYRSFEIEKSPENAAALLKLTPQTEQQETARYDISGHNCYGLTEEEDRALDSQYDGFSPLLAKAIMLAPQFMDRYVSYSLLATMDVHSEYTDDMVPVCRKFHSQFLRAVSQLSAKDQQWMKEHLFNPERCKSLYNKEE